ncbi:MAG: DUF721 domain-containing protein [Bdellovibrionota bacterium]
MSTKLPTRAFSEGAFDPNKLLGDDSIRKGSAPSPQKVIDLPDSKGTRSGAAAGKSNHKSTFQPRHRTPELIGGILDNAFRSPVIRKKVEEYAAFPYWEQIVGEQIAAVAIPEKISRGKVLRVRVLDAVWAQELSLMKQQIIEGIHRFGRGAIVEDVKFTIGNPKSFKKE